MGRSAELCRAFSQESVSLVVQLFLQEWTLMSRALRRPQPFGLPVLSALAIGTSYWWLGITVGAVTFVVMFVADSFPDREREEKLEGNEGKAYYSGPFGKTKKAALGRASIPSPSRQG